MMSDILMTPVPEKIASQLFDRSGVCRRRMLPGTPFRSMRKLFLHNILAGLRADFSSSMSIALNAIDLKSADNLTPL